MVIEYGSLSESRSGSPTELFRSLEVAKRARSRDALRQ